VIVMEAATGIERQTLKFIQDFYLANGYPPSIQEISSDNNVACNAIQGRVVHLARKGYITKKDNVARSIVITRQGRDELERLQ
jgi:SOS-response transcriptional repressor LexA